MISASSDFDIECMQQEINVLCPHCKVALSYIKGDPCNQAVLIHFHGWNLQSTSSSHSLATITIANACMRKSVRAGNNKSRVYAFVPVSELGRIKNPHKYDAFLQPLMEELSALYINGEQVQFAKKNVEEVVVSPKQMDTGLTTIRVVPLLLTGDMKAHGEVGLVSVSGYSGCRRCTVKGEYLRNHCRYGSFRYRYKHPSLPKTAKQNRQYGKQVDSIGEGNVKNELKRNYGVTGELPFYVFYDLCGCH